MQNPGQIDLEANEEHTLVVQFESATVADNAHIVLQRRRTMTDWKCPHWPRRISRGHDPKPLDFGVWGAMWHHATSDLSNQGLEDAVVYSISMANTSAFTLGELPILPLTLESGGFHPLDVLFSPQTEGTTSSSIDVVSNAPENAGVTSGTVQGEDFDPSFGTGEIEQSPPVTSFFC